MGETTNEADEALKAVQLDIATAELIREPEIRDRPGPWRALFTNRRNRDRSSRPRLAKTGKTR
jgi:hypothetical protein